MIDFFPIIRCHVGDVIRIFESAFDLESGDTCIDEFLQVCRTVQVLEREQIALMDRLSFFVKHFVHVLVQQVIRHAAELRTGTSVGRTVRQHFRDITASGIGHAEGTVHKGFEFDIGYRLMDGANLIDTQFTCQHGAFESQVTQVRHVFRCAVIALRGSMETNGR